MNDSVNELVTEWRDYYETLGTHSSSRASTAAPVCSLGSSSSPLSASCLTSKEDRSTTSLSQVGYSSHGQRVAGQILRWVPNQLNSIKPDEPIGNRPGKWSASIGLPTRLFLTVRKVE